MKQKITIYTVATDGRSGTDSHTFATKKEVEDWQRSVITEELQGTSADSADVEAINRHLDADEIDDAWTIYEDQIKDPLETYSFDETTLEIDIPIIDELMKALDEIESLPVDDEGSRTIPPGFLDGARALLARWERP